MTQFDAEKTYLSIKKGGRKPYVEKVHCPMILEVMNGEGTMTAFCVKAGISDATFSEWVRRHPTFRECYILGKSMSRHNWELQGKNNIDNDEFNWEYWRLIGQLRYNNGKTNKVRLEVDPDADPYGQYKQLIRQAGSEEFTAGELKQIMECINVGRSAFETFKLQESIDAMSDDIVRMKSNNEYNSSAVEAAPEANQDTVCNPLCESGDKA